MQVPIKTEDRTIAGRLRTANVVDAAMTTHGAKAADRLDVKHAARRAEGEPGTDYHALMEVDLRGDLSDAVGKMVAANTVHLGQLAVVNGLQEQRDAQKVELVDTFIQARHAVEHLHGVHRGFQAVGVTGPTLRDPAGLMKQVRETVDFFEAPKVPLAIRLDGVQVDLPAVARQLSAGATGLQATITEVARAQKQAEETRLAKNDAIDEYDHVYLYVGRTLEGLFHLAGMHELAERVRPSTRRPGRREADDKETSESGERAAGSETESSSRETSSPEKASSSIEV